MREMKIKVKRKVETNNSCEKEIKITLCRMLKMWSTLGFFEHFMLWLKKKKFKQTQIFTKESSTLHQFTLELCVGSI